MGLDVSYDCWDGPYSRFHRWRCALARAAGLPPLNDMEGFCRSENVGRAIKWKDLKKDPILKLLNHSDCDGNIHPKSCIPLANRLEELLPILKEHSKETGSEDWQETTKQFMRGLREAAANKQGVRFS